MANNYNPDEYKPYDRPDPNYHAWSEFPREGQGMGTVCQLPYCCGGTDYGTERGLQLHLSTMGSAGTHSNPLNSVEVQDQGTLDLLNAFNNQQGHFNGSSDASHSQALLQRHIDLLQRTRGQPGLTYYNDGRGHNYYNASTNHSTQNSTQPSHNSQSSAHDGQQEPGVHRGKPTKGKKGQSGRQRALAPDHDIHGYQRMRRAAGTAAALARLRGGSGGERW
ncbi:hypothetical protein T439DRAFT_329923 [Meredithblackwellia eburnea MCA 4105]